MRTITLFAVLPLLLGACSDSRGFTRRDSGRPVEPETDGGIVIDLEDGGEPVGPTCNAPFAQCGESCVDTQSDTRHCGECFNDCGSSAFCDFGECAPIETCTEPFTQCGEVCTNTATDSSNCGFCFNTCATGSTCQDGECIAQCASPRTLCDGDCVDTRSDNSNCGFCFNACGAGASCQSSSCQPTCTGGTTLCGESCTDTLTDAANCGGCGRVCSAGQTCSFGGCVTPSGNGESCSSAELFPAAGGTRTFTFTGRVANHTPFSCGATAARPDYVYRWTPSRSGTATITAAGSLTTTDTMLAVFDFSSCSSFDEVGCNDDRASGMLDSQLSLSVTAGATYYIVVGSYATPAPTDTITVRVTAP